ncbi:hypothetical protein L1887_11056 [Cichorium endivia]|nr:hypothetical protein L1887_11056 [Cichorium endivia]
MQPLSLQPWRYNTLLLPGAVTDTPLQITPAEFTNELTSFYHGVAASTWNPSRQQHHDHDRLHPYDHY